MFTLLLLLAACGERDPKPAASAERPPNVLLITLDTLRADALGSYGAQVPSSPNLDALAQDSVRFTRAYTVTPLTIPAHSSIMTGMFPPRHGVRDNGDFFLSEGAITLAERLKVAGYRTMASVGAEVTSHHWGFSQGFDAYFDDMGGPEGDEQNRWRVERRGDAVVDDALSWLEQNGTGEQPFFAWVHLFDVHHPYEAPEPFASQFPRRPYLAEVAWTDSQVGRLLAWLQDKAQMDRTAVLVMADHGEGLGSHGESFHGVLLYNATTHIPMIVRPPGGLEAAARVSFPVSLVDVAPTVMGLAGLPPGERLDGMDLGRWLVPSAGAPASPVDRAVYLEALYGWRHYGWAPQRALVTDDAKFIDSTTPELYRRDDAQEKVNLAETAAAQATVLRERTATMYAAMKPDEALSAAAELSPERLAQLEALGYVTSGAETAGEGFGEGLPDPVTRLPSLKRLEDARAAMQSGDMVAAEATIRAIVAEEPGLDQAQNMLASALAAQGKVDEALGILATMDQRQPSANLKTAMGVMELRRLRLDHALVLLEAALEGDPYLGMAWTPYLHTLFLMGDLQRLGERSAHALTLLPDLAAAQAAQGVLLAIKGDVARAEPLLQRVHARDPLLPMVNYGLGLVATTRGDVDAAEGFYEEDVRSAPPALASRRELVRIYATQQRWAEQIAQLDVILKVQPGDMLSLRARAQARYNLKQYAEAEQDLERCLALDPSNAECKMLQANALKRLGRPEEAEAAYQEALRLKAEPRAP